MLEGRSGQDAEKRRARLEREYEWQVCFTSPLILGSRIVSAGVRRLLMMPSRSDPSPTQYYFTGGTLSADAGSYVVRRSDTEIVANLLRGEFCYVLNSRQMGKSSLMVRTVRQL